MVSIGTPFDRHGSSRPDVQTPKRRKQKKPVTKAHLERKLKAAEVERDKWEESHEEIFQINATIADERDELQRRVTELEGRLPECSEAGALCDCADLIGMREALKAGVNLFIGQTEPVHPVYWIQWLMSAKAALPPKPDAPAV